MRFKKLISNSNKKAFTNLMPLYPHRFLLNVCLKTDSLVLSFFNYCDVVYGLRLDEVNVNSIEGVQRSFLRFIYGITQRQEKKGRLFNKWGYSRNTFVRIPVAHGAF